MAEELVVVSSKDMDIQSRIMTIRGVQVMLDRDLAALYGVETKVLNQAVKRNAERFPEGFMFQLTDAEWLALRSQIVTSNTPSANGLASLRSQFVISKRGGQRYRPYVFTEHGVVMLASVLKSEAAVQASLRIVSVFVAMRRAFSSMAPLLTRIEATERRQITDQSRNEARFDELFAKMSEGEVPLAQIFYQGKFWDAKSLLVKFIRRAKKELIVIDPYVGVATLDMLAKRTRGVKVELVTHSNGELADSDFEAFAKQCGKFTKTICGTCHDRFIIIDRREIFWSGASLKDAGRLTFAVAKMGPEVIPGLLASVRKAETSKC